MSDKALRVKSAHPATSHFWYQRLTALDLIPVTVWLIVFFHKSLNAPHAETLEWLRSPANAAAACVWAIAATYHAALGMQVVIEDYVSTIPVRRWAIRGSHLIFLVLGVAALVAIAFILFPR